MSSPPGLADDLRQDPRVLAAYLGAGDRYREDSPIDSHHSKKETRMTRTVVVPPTGLRAGLPYSPAIRWDRLLFISGQTGSDPVTREFPADIKAQTRIALENVKALAEAGGASMDCRAEDDDPHDRHDERVRCDE